MIGMRSMYFVPPTLAAGAAALPPRGRNSRLGTALRRSYAIAIGAAAVALAVSACGERPQVINYKQGTYQGKPDTPAYSNAPFNGNRQQWESAVSQRNQAQNEYMRTRD